MNGGWTNIAFDESYRSLGHDEPSKMPIVDDTLANWVGNTIRVKILEPGVFLVYTYFLNLIKNTPCLYLYYSYFLFLSSLFFTVFIFSFSEKQIAWQGKSD